MSGDSPPDRRGAQRSAGRDPKGGVLVVGAGLAVTRAAETLRAKGFTGTLTLVGDEPYPPYERPALSKEFLAGEKSESDLYLRPEGSWEERQIELRLGSRVEALDQHRGEALLADGSHLRFSQLILATGARARLLPELPEAVHTLRTLADAKRLRTEIKPGRRLVVVGGGFVGAEVASTARKLGVEVVVIEAQEAPMVRPLGVEVGRLLAERMRASGIELKLGIGLERIEPSGRALRVRLADGSAILADSVLLAIGVSAAQELLPAERESGALQTAGDVVGPGHWTHAGQDGVRAACRLLGLEPPAPQPHYVWSDQFGLRLQLVGNPQSAQSHTLEGEDSSFAARYHDGEGQLVAALLANRPQEVALLRKQLPAAQMAAG